MKKIIVYLACMLLILSCGKDNKPPSPLIQPAQMKGILWDMITAQSLAAEMASKDSVIDVAIQTKKLSKEVFIIHHIDSATFNKSYNWYVQHPDILKTLFDSLSVQKERETHETFRNKIHKEVE